MPTPVPSSTALSPFADTWSVEPTDPSFIPGSREANEIVLRQVGSELQGVGPEKAPLRFWAQGETIVGEARDPQGKAYKLTLEWLEPGRRIVLKDEAGKAMTLRRGPLETVFSETLLYEASQDLNGDGVPETARVLSLDGNAEPNSPSPKALRIVARDGTVVFHSETFEEPFRTDLDSLAESSEQKAGLHILKSSRYPRIRLIFATRSGNFVDFQFNGREYAVAGMEDS